MRGLTHPPTTPKTLMRRIGSVLIVGVVLLAIAAPALALNSPLAQDTGRHVAWSDAAPRAVPESQAPPAVAANGVVSGMVFFDANGDGVRGPNETTGVEGAVVALRTPGGSEVASYTTLIDGAYQFSSVAAGTYLVVETDQISYVSTSSNSLTVTVGVLPVSSVDFGDTLPFHVTGQIYDDTNGDGRQQPLEKGLPLVPVELYNDLNADGLIDATDPLLDSTETDAGGVYSFHNVMPGYRVLKITPPVGSGSPSGNQASLNLISSDGFGTNEFVWNFPLRAATEAAPACAFNSSIVSNFNGTAIPAPRIVWFTARLKASGLPAGVETTVYFDNTEIQFGTKGTAYHLAPGRGKVVFSPTATASSTTYDASADTWTTTVSPGNWGHEVFLTGLAFAAPAEGLPGGINPVTWSGRLSGSRAGITLEWKWSAAVYASLSSDYNADGVKPVSGNIENPYSNGDAAGSPEKYTSYVTGGGRGGGGSNYTGGDTPAARGLCITPAVPPYGTRVNCGGTVFTDSLAQTWRTDRAYTLGAWGYVGGSAKSAGAGVGGTVDDFLYQRYREAPAEYRFTVPNDTYDVLLKFADFGAQNPGERVMAITMEGATVESGLDIYATAGKYYAVDQKYKVSVSDGVLNIAFAKTSGSSRPPVVSAIQVVPHPAGPPPSPTPPTPTPPTPQPTDTPTPPPTPAPYVLGVNSGSTTYTAAGGEVWSGDKAYKVGSWGYMNGAAKSVKVEVTNTTEDPLYRAYRESPVEYRFTVPNGTYQVVLKFAEFTASGPNDRLMQLSIEGKIVENSFSIWTAANGKNAAVDKTYTATVKDGMLNIGFVKASGSNKPPVISAIKVSGQ